MIRKDQESEPNV